MINYLDTSALIKLIKRDRESHALQAWIRSRSRRERLLSSELSRLELTRTLVRHGYSEDALGEALRQMQRIVDLTLLSREILAMAEGCRITQLGTLDALHLATAQVFENELRTFVTYDKELATAAAGEGFVVVAPN